MFSVRALAFLLESYSGWQVSKGKGHIMQHPCSASSHSDCQQRSLAQNLIIPWALVSKGLTSAQCGQVLQDKSEL